MQKWLFIHKWNGNVLFHFIVWCCLAVAGNQNVRHIPLDLGDIQSIQSFASDVLNSSNNIHLLINNAGNKY